MDRSLSGYPAKTHRATKAEWPIAGTVSMSSSTPAAHDGAPGVLSGDSARLDQKTEGDIHKVQCCLADMRRDGPMPFDWIADNHTPVSSRRCFAATKHALRQTAAARTAIRRDLLAGGRLLLSRSGWKRTRCCRRESSDRDDTAYPLMVSRGLFQHHLPATPRAGRRSPASACRRTSYQPITWADFDPSRVHAKQ